MAEYQFSVGYSEAVVREAVRAFLRHRLRRMWKLWIGIFILAAATVWLFWIGDRSWFLGITAGALSFSILLLWSLYRAHLRDSLGRLRRMQVPRADIKLQEESLTIKSDAGAATLPWSAIKEILAEPAFWLLCLETNSFLTLPTHNVPVEALDYIRSRIVAGPRRRGAAL